MRRSLVVLPIVVIGAGVFVASRLGGSDGSSLSTPKFVDETVAAGVDHAYDGEFPFFVGGGVATFDCNGDDLPELFFAGGVNASELYVNKSAVGGPLAFQRDDSPLLRRPNVTGAYPIDIDGDATTDLVVLGRGGNTILRGLGNCAFEDATTSLGLTAGKEWTVGFSATWEAGERLPTLAFGNYLVPDTYDCSSNELFRPQGDRYATADRLPAH